MRPHLKDTVRHTACYHSSYPLPNSIPLPFVSVGEIPIGDNDDDEAGNNSGIECVIVFVFLYEDTVLMLESRFGDDKAGSGDDSDSDHGKILDADDIDLDDL